jgi:anti-sigma-K factor RskA
MTDEPDPTDRNTMAGEFALGLLSGDDLREARELAANDPAFAKEVARWRGRSAALLDDIEPIAPPEGVWNRVKAAIEPAKTSNVIQLRRRVGFWRGATAGMTALAASLALVLVMRPEPTVPVVPAPAIASTPPMIAMLSDDQKQMKVMASWNPDARQLVLAVAGEATPDPAHAHEVWIIPAGGKPRSLGTMGKPMVHMQLADALATLLQQGATIAISAEPTGGSPTGAPTGPMIASGTLSRA